MAVMRMDHMNTKKHLLQGIDYITKKSISTISYNFLKENYFEEMINTQKKFGKDIEKISQKGKSRHGYHFIFSFNPEESKKLNIEQIQIATYEILEALGYLDKYEIVTAIHDDKEHKHVHIIFNSVSYVDGKKFRYEKNDFKLKMQNKINEILQNNQISIIPLESTIDPMIYNEWKENKNQDAITIRKLIKFDIAESIKNANSMSELLKELKEKLNYQVRENRKYVTLKHPFSKRYIRINSLKGKFTEDKLNEYFNYKKLGIIIEDINFKLPKAKIDYSILTKENLTIYQKKCKEELIQHLKIQNGIQYKNRVNVSKKEILNFQKHAEFLYLKIRYNLDSKEKIRDVISDLESKIKLEENEKIKKELFLDYRKMRELEEEEKGGKEIANPTIKQRILPR